MTDKEKYDKAVLAALAANTLLNLHRCINCDNYSTAGCEVHQTPIPDDYLYTPNDCAQWLPIIPF
jgi:hypothetical protein